MENNELLIEGLIYHGPGCCPDCGGPIVVADTETTVMELNDDGVPISDETYQKCSGACTRCGKRINMMRWGGGYIPYSAASKIVRINDFKEECKQRILEINKNAKGKNPFTD